MSSVRHRLERERREAAEHSVETSTRRTALGASGPTMSTRQREQLAADENEVAVVSNRIPGQTGFAHGAVTRTRDRMVIETARQPEPARSKTPTEQAADYYYALHLRKLEKHKADEQAKLAARQKREADEKAAAELKQRRATIAFQEAQVDHEGSDLSPDERRRFYERLASMNKMLDPQAASTIAEEIRTSRKV